MAKKKAISGAPTGKVTSLGKSARDNLKFTADWKVPAGLTKDTNPKRFQHLDLQWNVYSKAGQKTKQVDKTKLFDKSVSTTKSTLTLKREEWWPKSERKITKVAFKVRGTNSKGKGPWAKADTAEYTDKKGNKKTRHSYDVDPAKKPSISTSFNSDNGTVSWTVKAGEDTGNQERYDTAYTKAIKEVVNGQGSWVEQGEKTTTSDEFTVTYDVAGWQSHKVWTDYKAVRITARCRGIGGDSDKVTATRYLSYPYLKNISSIDIPETTNPNGRVTVYLSDDSSFTADQKETHPIDKVKLQILRNTDAATAETATASDAWTDVENAIDDQQCTALADTVANAMPEGGKRTWYRVVCYHDTLTRTSAPVEAKQLYKAGAADDECEIIAIQAGDDGKSAVVTVAWTDDDSTATEVSWSTDPEAWESTDAPDTFAVTYSEPYAGAPDGTWTKQATLKIVGLASGVQVYVKARRYYEGDTTTYGPYCNVATCTPATVPDDVTLIAPAVIKSGDSLPISWTFSGGGTQTGWQCLCGNVPVATGTDSSGSATLAWERVQTFLDGANTVELFISVTTGGEWVDSSPVIVQVSEPPTLALSLAETTTAQPVTFTVTSSKACPTLSACIKADGAAGYGPDGERVQIAGDNVWASNVTPSWAANEDGTYTATITAPTGLPLFDIRQYTLSASVTDTLGASSGTYEAGTTIAWAHQATAPSATIETAIDEDSGTIAATITPVAPDDAAPTDLADIYRVTPDGAYLIAEGIEFGTEVSDPYAPFAAASRGWQRDPLSGFASKVDRQTEADLRYRIALRTADGDIEWADEDYDLAYGAARFDWQGGYLEMPFNIEWEDSWSKGFERRERLDGSRAGYWTPGASRDGSVKATMIRLTDPAQIEAARELAQHDGPVFVRLPNGTAYEADVQLSLSGSVTGVDVSIEAKEVDLTDAFRSPTLAKGEAATSDTMTATEGA